MPVSTVIGAGRSPRGAIARIAAICLALVPSSFGRAADPPRRVVSFNICADQLVVALADPAQIAGLSPYATDPTLSAVAAKARAFRRCQWHAESVVPLDPDLVLVGPRDRSVTQRMLAALGFRVVGIDFVGTLAAAREQIRAGRRAARAACARGGVAGEARCRARRGSPPRRVRARPRRSGRSRRLHRRPDEPRRRPDRGGRARAAGGRACRHRRLRAARKPGDDASRPPGACTASSSCRATRARSISPILR